MSASPQGTQGIIRLVPIAAGIAVAAYVNSDKVIDYTLAKTASIYTHLAYQADEDANGAPKGFFSRAARGVSKFIDKNALALGWKVDLMNYDESALIKSDTIVRFTLGLGTALVTKSVISALLK